jgi:uncharacterized membrane protein
MKAQAAPSWTDRRIEDIIGTLLRVGVLTAAGVVLLGAAVFLLRNGHEIVNYKVFRGEPDYLRNVPGIVRYAFGFSGRGIIQLGLLLLIATPIARVAFSAIAFWFEKDRLYVLLTLVVLGILVFSLSGHVP